MSIGNIGAQGTITKTKFVPEVYEVGDLPDSNYAPAGLRLSDIETGVAKYFKPVKHWTMDQLYSDLCVTFALPVPPNILSGMVFKEFTSYFPGLNLYLSKKLPFKDVLKYMTHDISGALRKKTSAGLGFKHDRKFIARNYADDVLSCYELDTFDFDIYWKMFLKDELREKTKETRSIAVAQLHLWVICMTYLGGVYEWFSDFLPAWTGYGIDHSCASWNSKLQYFDASLPTYGFDIRQQDSKMSPGFIDFIVMFFKSITPVKHWGAIEWYFDQTFYYKKLVDARGNILMFSNGQPSGNTLTIIINTMHNLYTHVIHNVISRLLQRTLLDFNGDDVGESFIILGDDTIMQSNSPDLYKAVCTCLGHDTTSESGTLFDVSFLSMKICLYKGRYAPYYSNLDKMYASLRYTTGGEDEYFQKLCSFYTMLIYAPLGSEELEWKKRIEAHILWFIQQELIRPELLACFKPSHLQKRERSGMEYHSCSPGFEGGLKYYFDNMSSANTIDQTRSQKRRAKKKQKKEAKKSQAKSQNVLYVNVPVHHKVSASRKRKMENTALSVSRKGLSGKDAKWAQDYIMELLWPTRPIRLVRPVPVRTFPYFKRGEIIFTSANKYTEVQFRPNPWRFIELREDIADSVISFDSQYLTSYADAGPYTLLTGTTHYLCFNDDLKTTTNTVVPINHRNLSGAPTVISKFSGEISSGSCDGWPSLTCQGTLTASLSNETGRTLTAALDVLVVNADESVATTVSGTVASITSGNIVNYTSASLVGVTVNSTQLLVPVVRVVNSSGYSVFLKDLSISWIGASANVVQTQTAVTKVYTFGTALFPDNDDLASQVMQAFSESKLWSPVAMACLYNVTQELAKAGGKFSASYLPSFISQDIPEDFSQAWQTLATWATSYPHYEGEFIKGAHASWLGGRMEDYTWLKPSARDQILEYEAISAPSNVFMSNAASVTSEFTYYITFAAAFEIQTLSPNFTCRLGPSSTLLMPQFLSLAAASEDLVGENPSHMKRLKSLANKIFADPTVQQGFKSLGGAALSALMMV